MTARMLAWKQPFIQRVRNSSLVEGLGVDNNRVSNLLPKPRNPFLGLVGEHSIGVEGIGRPVLELMEKQM